MSDHQPDYSWIKPGVLAVLVNTRISANDGTVVRCVSGVLFCESNNTLTGEVSWGPLVYIEPVAPHFLVRGSMSNGSDEVGVHPSRMRPLPDFDDEADVQGISLDMKIVE